MDMKREGRQAGGLMLAGTGASVMLMLRHPTSLRGPDDGLLLGDWSNAGVHGGMIVCLMAIGLGASSVPRRLGEGHLSVRAGRMLFAGGIAALVVAALVNGFASGWLLERVEAPALRAIQFPVLAALNQTFAVFGMALVAGAMALWAVRMLRLDWLGKAAGVAGLGAGGLALWWLAVGDGFGLMPAVVAALVFAAWSVLTAVRLMRGPWEPAQ